MRKKASVGYFEKKVIAEYNPQAYALLQRVQELDELANVEQALGEIKHRLKKQVGSQVWEQVQLVQREKIKAQEEVEQSTLRRLPEAEQLRVLEREVQRLKDGKVRLSDRSKDIIDKEKVKIPRGTFEQEDQEATIIRERQRIMSALRRVPEIEQLSFVEQELERLKRTIGNERKIKQVVAGKVYYQIILDLDTLGKILDAGHFFEAAQAYEKLAMIFVTYQSFLQTSERAQLYQKLLRMYQALRQTGMFSEDNE